MRAPAKAIPVKLAVALAQRQRPYPTVITERSRLFPDVVEQVLLYVAQFPLQIGVTDPVSIVTIVRTDCGFLKAPCRNVKQNQRLVLRRKASARAQNGLEATNIFFRSIVEAGFGGAWSA